MGTTSKSAWVDCERWLASLFGTKRRPLSGNTSGRDDQDGSDSMHETLYLEAKLKKSHALRTLHDHCKKRAKGKPVVIGLRSKGRPGGLIVVHSDDLAVMCVEWLKVQPIGGSQ